MPNEISPEERERRSVEFKRFLATVKKEHEHEMSGLNPNELAVINFNDNKYSLRIHEKVNAGIRKIIYAKWLDLFPQV